MKNAGPINTDPESVRSYIFQDPTAAPLTEVRGLSQIVKVLGDIVLHLVLLQSL